MALIFFSPEKHHVSHSLGQLINSKGIYKSQRRQGPTGREESKACRHDSKTGIAGTERLSECRQSTEKQTQSKCPVSIDPL